MPYTINMVVEGAGSANAFECETVLASPDDPPLACLQMGGHVICGIRFLLGTVNARGYHNARAFVHFPEDDDQPLRIQVPMEHQSGLRAALERILSLSVTGRAALYLELNRQISRKHEDEEYPVPIKYQSRSSFQELWHALLACEIEAHAIQLLTPDSIRARYRMN